MGGEIMDERSCEAVRQVHLRPGMSVGELVSQLGSAGAFNAGSLAEAADVYEMMLQDPGCRTFFGLAGAMVPAGMGGIVADLIDRGYIDVLVTTGANLTHDIIEAIGCAHYHGTEVCDDVQLHKSEINRIYDVYLPHEAFLRFEEFMQDILSSIPDGKTLSIHGLLRHIASPLRTGILATAMKKDVPIFCPGIQDSMIGLQYWLFGQTHRVTVDAFADMRELMDHCFGAERAGVFVMGGGVPKNYILQSMLMTPRGFSYAIQLTGDRPDLGGLSGATLDEARSWGKIGEDARAVTVYGDATITFPLVVAAVLERLER
ncbi:MAG: deoxyhypusine synthase [Methanomicrobiaceae archaeon]|nr:deoxyhypusine synthase [Methanomicrobiaceae archaeon]